MLESDRPGPPEAAQREKLASFAREQFPKADDLMREIAVDAVCQIKNIPDEKLGETVYEIDNKAIDDPVSHAILLDDGPLSSKWADTQTTIFYYPDTASKKLQTFKGELAGRLTNLAAEKKMRSTSQFGLNQQQRKDNTSLTTRLVEALDSDYFKK